MTLFAMVYLYKSQMMRKTKYCFHVCGFSIRTFQTWQSSKLFNLSFTWEKNPYFPFCGIFLVDITFQAYYYFICISMTNVQTFINTIRHVISTVSNYSRFLHIPDIKSNIQLCGKDSRVVIYLNTLILTSFNQKLICHQSSLSS